MEQKEITLAEVWKANEESLGHEIKMGTNLFKQVRIMYLLQIDDVEEATFQAMQSKRLWKFFKECLANFDMKEELEKLSA